MRKCLCPSKPKYVSSFSWQVFANFQSRQASRMLFLATDFNNKYTYSFLCIKQWFFKKSLKIFTEWNFATIYDNVPCYCLYFIDNVLDKAQSCYMNAKGI